MIVYHIFKWRRGCHVRIRVVDAVNDARLTGDRSGAMHDAGDRATTVSISDTSTTASASTPPVSASCAVDRPPAVCALPDGAAEDALIVGCAVDVECVLREEALCHRSPSAFRGRFTTLPVATCGHPPCPCPCPEGGSAMGESPAIGDGLVRRRYGEDAARMVLPGGTLRFMCSAGGAA